MPKKGIDKVARKKLIGAMVRLNNYEDIENFMLDLAYESKSVGKYGHLASPVLCYR